MTGTLLIIVAAAAAYFGFKWLTLDRKSKELAESLKAYQNNYAALERQFKILKKGLETKPTVAEAAKPMAEAKTSKLTKAKKTKTKIE